MNIIRRIYQKLSEGMYHVGIIAWEDLNYELSPNLSNKVNWVKNAPKTSWYADPFIFKVTDNEIHLFVEEKPYVSDKGVLTLLVIDRRSYRYLRSKVILQLSTHLSFPYIMEIGGNTYVIPENYQSGKSISYLYDEVKEELVFHKVLIEEPLTDAIYFEKKGQMHTLATRIENCNGNVCCHYIDGKLYEEILFPDDSARSAGHLFELDGKVYRPNQDCNGSYGRGVVLYELNETFEHKEKLRIFPSSKRYNMKFHTFNVGSKGYIAVDGFGYRYKVGSLLEKLKNLIKKE